jgi:DnaJ family protein C protein 11
VPSNRSTSLAFDEYLHPSSGSQTPPAHALRSASSRFSLNEQFATSRQEYDFDDDASSIYERSTEAGDMGSAPLTAIDESWQNVRLAPVNDSDVDYYDLLCIPRHPRLPPDHVRKAYWRSLFLIHSAGGANADLMGNATAQKLQRAFETLVDPVRRAEYDSRRVLQGSEDAEAEDDYERQEAYQASLEDALGLAALRQSTSATDMGIRFDVSEAADTVSSRTGSSVRPVDFIIDHSFTTSLPISASVSSANDAGAPWSANILLATSPSSRVSQVTPKSYSLEVHNPEVTVSGLIGGRFAASSVPARSQKPSQPWPALAGYGTSHVGELPLVPIAAAKLRQDITFNTPSGGVSRYTIEVEREVLSPGLTTRISHPITLENPAVPWILDASLYSGHSSISAFPLVGFGAHRIGSEGTFSVSANSGSWGKPLDATCRSFAEFSRQVMLGGVATTLPPSIDLGYATHDADFTSQVSRRESSRRRFQPSEIKTWSPTSWSASSTVTPGSAAGYLRYGKDLYLPISSGATTTQSSARLELELSSDTYSRHSFALRSLWRVGVYTTLGLEVSMSSQALHLSLHWSRLKHRFSLPLLVSSLASTASKLVYWTVVLPFAAVGASQLLLSHRRRTSKRSRTTGELQAHSVKQRAEAEEYTRLVFSVVDEKQRQRRDQGELVILGATYTTVEAAEGKEDDGCWVAEEAANVTTPLAALIDEDGALLIPFGVRKAGLPGFWDPAPGRDKVLQVRYSYRGREAAVQVSGRDGLSLPPAH